MIDPLPLALVIFFAIFTQSATGFGFALVSMPFLAQILPDGLQTAVPLGVLIGIVNQSIMVARYRAAFNLRAVIRLVIPSLFGVPLGVVALRQIPQQIILLPLGVVVALYALYALLVPRLPDFDRPIWTYSFGFVAGVLGGAYNTNGPPLVIYGNAHGWEPAEFKSNLQGFFLINSPILVISHVVVGNFTPAVWESFLISIPAMALGMTAAFALDRFVNPLLFRRIVLVMLVGVGVSLVARQLAG